MPPSGSRTEFLAVDALGSANDIQYSRTGGWFVSIKKALLIGLLVILAMVLVGILVHYLSTCKGGKSDKDIGIITEPSVQTPNGSNEALSLSDELLLPGDITPLFYRLRLEPYLDDLDPEGKNFTYKGHATIRVQCHNATNKVSFHAKRLNIGEDIKISLLNDTAVQTEPTTALTTATTTTPVPAPTSTTRGNNVTSELELTTPAGTNDTSTLSTLKATTNVITTTHAGPRRKRNAPFRSRRHRRRQATETTPVPKTTQPQGTPPRVTGRFQEDGKDIYIINVEPALEEGKTYVLDIPFTGLLDDSLFGFYRSSYMDENGTKRWMASTHFEPTHAREAFPCFDEPDLKAQFEISISRRVNMTTLSNMPIRATEPVDGQFGRVWDHYEVTPKMSTYLIAFIVAHSDFIPTTDLHRNKSAPDFRIYSRKQVKQAAKYASYIGPRILEFYADYFGVPYPLPKLYMAAIPDFPVAGMENWGLITYRESIVLYDPKSSSMSDKDNMVTTVAHELAHQWFGNLVTMKWWNDIWLNEGFATFMQYLGSNYVEPSSAMLDKFLVYEQQHAMSLDCLRSTHTVSTRVDNPSQISEVFDYVSYSKGASLIRMLYSTLTEDVLRKGLTHYLNKWKYKNTAESDFWRALTVQVRKTPGSLLPENVTVQEVMDTWTLQKGFPVLSVTRDYIHDSASISQARFTLDNSSSDTMWYIPVSYATQQEMKDATNSSTRYIPRLWLKKEPTTTIHNLTKSKSNETWVLFNIDATGYYRVNYDTRNWELLAAHLMNSPQEERLSAITRAQLLDDALNLAQAGILGYEVALNMTRYLATSEHHYVPWRAVFENMKFLELMLRQTTAYGHFQDYMFKTLMVLKNSLGFEPSTNETELQTLLRPYVLMWLSNLGDPTVIKWAKDLYEQWTISSNPDTENPIHVDVRGVVYCTAVRTGGRGVWEFIRKRFTAATDRPTESEELLASLTCTNQEWLLVTLLEKSLENDGQIRLQDSVTVWLEMPSSAISSRVAFNYIRNNWSSIYDKFGKNELLIGSILKGAISGLTTELDNRDVKEFYNTNKRKLNFAERKMKLEMEALQLRVDWYNRNYRTVASWLHNY